MSDKHKHKQESLLVVSDIHRGAKISDLPAYEKSLLKKMSKYDHVVLNGDIFELFYIDPQFYGIDDPNRPAKSDESKKEQKHRRAKYIVKRAVKDSIELLDEFLTDNPKCHLHFVLGNHENVRVFRRFLDKLQDKHKNFEWDPQAIRVGSALFVHGDLAIDPQNGKTDAERKQSRLRDSHGQQGVTYWQSRAAGIGHVMDEFAHHPSLAADKVRNWLMDHEGKLTYSHECEKRTFRNSEEKRGEGRWLKKVFFGHTHVKFEAVEIDGVKYYNTGAMVRATSRQNPGVLEAEIINDRVRHVRPLAADDLERRAVSR